MERFLHIYFIHFRKLSLALFFAGFCWLAYGFNFPQSASPAVQQVKCYPNPATSFVNFEFTNGVDKNNTIQVFSFVGKKMTELPVNANKITVTLTDYYRGIYVFQLRDKGGNIIESGKFSVVK